MQGVSHDALFTKKKKNMYRIIIIPENYFFPDYPEMYMYTPCILDLNIKIILVKKK